MSVINVIGNFPQGENAIYLDYEDMINKAKSNGQDFGTNTMG